VRNGRKHQSGQALTELMILLIGFVAVFLGLLFVCGLSDGDINIFLLARNQAELTAAGGSPSAAAGAEFGTAENYRHDIYSVPEPLVFSPRDTVDRRASNSIDGFPGAFSASDASDPEDRDGDYRLQAKMNSWKKLSDAGNGALSSDFVTDLTLHNAFSAADLVAGRASGVGENTLVNSSAQKPGTAEALRQTFFSWFGVRFSGRALIDAPGNQVYMPVFSR